MTWIYYRLTVFKSEGITRNVQGDHKGLILVIQFSQFSKGEVRSWKTACQNVTTDKNLFLSDLDTLILNGSNSSCNNQNRDLVLTCSSFMKKEEWFLSFADTAHKPNPWWSHPHYCSFYSMGLPVYISQQEVKLFNTNVIEMSTHQRRIPLLEQTFSHCCNFE